MSSVHRRAGGARVARIRDVNGLPRWHLDKGDSRVENGEPSDRVDGVPDFHLRNGHRIPARLLGSRDEDIWVAHLLLEGPMPLENDGATLTPVTDGDRTLIAGAAAFDCSVEVEAELAETIGRNVFWHGFNALKHQFLGMRRWGCSAVRPST